MANRSRIAAAVAALVLLANNANGQTANEVESIHLMQVEVDETQPPVEQATTFILDRLENGGQRNLLHSYLLSGFSAGGNITLVNQNGTDNEANVLQFGLSNLAVVSQQGSDNATLLEQIGNNNIFGAWLTGDGNLLSVHQEGHDNLYVLDFVGSDLNHSVLQIGNGIEAYQVGAASRPFSIEQYGSRMNIRIEHNSP